MAEYSIAKLPPRVFSLARRWVKIDKILDPAGNPVANFQGVPGAVNSLTVTNSVDGAAVSLSAPDGVDLVGTVNGSTPLTAAQINAATSKTTPVDADELALVDSEASNGLKKLTIANLKAWWAAATVTLTNKTLTAPKIATIKDANNNTILDLSPLSSAVNNLQIVNNVAGAAPQLKAAGSDTNVDINLVGQGSGTARVNGIAIATLSNTQTLTNKTLTAPKISGGSGTATISAGTGTPEGAVTATVGSIFMRTDGGAATTLYVKESGTGNTGWVAK